MAVSQPAPQRCCQKERACLQPLAEKLLLVAAAYQLFCKAAGLERLLSCAAHG